MIHTQTYNHIERQVFLRCILQEIRPYTMDCGEGRRRTMLCYFKTDMSYPPSYAADRVEITIANTHRSF